MLSRETSVFYFRHLAVPLVVFALIVSLIALTGADQALTGIFYDPAKRAFPWRDTWLLETVEHVAAKRAVVLLGFLVLVAWIAARWSADLRPLRPILLFVFLGMLLAAMSVASLKQASYRYCPYDLQQYGGAHVETGGMFAEVPKGAKPGRCWPSGHASSGFCLFAWYFAARHVGRRRLAAGLLAGTLAFGLLLGLGRVAQGAHFLSHCIWSAAICWFVTVALYEIVLVRRFAFVRLPALPGRPAAANE